jgi:hypothetical protein
VIARLPRLPRRSWPVAAALGHPVLLAGVIVVPLAALYLAFTPQTGDLAAATYRADLFSRAGAVLWDNGWYGGHHVPAYSILAPPLAALMGPARLGALSGAIAAVLFGALVARARPAPAARWAAAWFAAGDAVTLLSGRIPFTLGLAFGLAAALAVQRGRGVLGAPLAALLAVCCAVSSPVAGFFLALGGVALALSSGVGAAALRWRAAGAVLVIGGLAPVLLLLVLFPEGGSEPFAANAFWPDLVLLFACVGLLPRRERLLRVSGVLYAIVLIGSYAVPSALGGNVDRLGAMLAGPLVALALATRSGWAGARAARRWRWGLPRRAQALLALTPLLAYWQVIAPIRDSAAAVGDPSVHASYYAPLLAHLPAGPRRIEIVFTRQHWEAAWVAPHVAIARGWERQLDVLYNGLFYRPRLDARSYEQWLAQNAISYVALSDAPLDYSAVQEARLVRGGLPYLHEVWRGAHWQLYAVLGATPLVSGRARLAALGGADFELAAPAPGVYLVRVRFTPYWALEGAAGCVAPAPGDWTLVRLAHGGRARVAISFALGRVRSRSARCSG